MNYIGSKARILEFISNQIQKHSGFTDGQGKIFADLFSGTGVVAKTFKEQGYFVLANDIQHYSYLRVKHFIENSQVLPTILFPVFNNLQGQEGFIYENYCLGSGSGRNYFSDSNGKRCDHIRREIEQYFMKNTITEAQHCHLVASLLEEMDKCANTASIYGAYLKTLKKSAIKPLNFKPLPIVQGVQGKVYQENALNLIPKIKGDILYLDPPYNQRQYASNYHLLETIARYDSPPLHGKAGLRDYSDTKSAFCSKKTVCESLEQLIKQADFQYVYLSYNNEGLLDRKTIQTLMEQFGDYTVVTQNHTKYSNRTEKQETTVEFLHCLTKK